MRFVVIDVMDFKENFKKNLYFHGRVSVRVKKGRVRVMGYTLQENREYEISSPFCSSAIFLEGLLPTKSDGIKRPDFNNHETVLQ
jgi:hypothetical protein